MEKQGEGWGTGSQTGLVSRMLARDPEFPHCQSSVYCMRKEWGEET